jgi:hypothetical protein
MFDSAMAHHGKETRTMRQSIRSLLLLLTLPALAAAEAATHDTLDRAPLEYLPGGTPQAVDTVKPVTVDEGREAGGRTVSVRARRRPARAAGQSRVTAKEIKRLPGLAEPDVIRAVQALPGVVASSDFSTKLYVRGAGSDQNLVLFDDAVVYSPMHFGGLFSTFLADAVGDMDMHKGGFDARYGNRLSSVLRVHSKTPADTGRVSGQARITTASGSLAAEGRQGDVAWVLAGRRTWIDQALGAARAAGATDFDLPYYFYDTQGSLAWGRAGDTVRASFYHGRDNLELGLVTMDWGNTAIPVNVRKRLGGGFTWNGTFAWSSFDQLSALGDIQETTNRIEDWNTRQELAWNLNASHQFALGYEYDRYDISFRQVLPIYDLDNREAFDTHLHAAWLRHRWVLSPRHSLLYGLRGYGYPETGTSGWDPRATYTWRPARDWRLDLHAGRYTQFLTSIRWADQETMNEFWYAAREGMDPAYNHLVSAGVERSDWTRLKLRATAEAYYKDIHDLPVYFPNRSAGDREDLDSTEGFALGQEFAKVDGYSAGVEFALKREEGALSGEISYALSKAVLKQQDYVNGSGTHSFRAYPADWDQRHTAKAQLNVNWRGAAGEALWASGKKGRYLRSTVIANYHTGLPHTGFQDYYGVHEPDQGRDGADGSGPPAYLKDNLYLRQGNRNAETRSDYFRLDVTPVDWGREGRWRLYWTLINVTDRKNVFLVNYDTTENPPRKEEAYQMPFLPIMVGYEYQF